MPIVNMLDAKTRLSRLVDAVESGAETEIIIARNGKPAAKLVPVTQGSVAGKRLGLLAGRYPALSLDDFNANDETVGALFADDR